LENFYSNKSPPLPQVKERSQPLLPHCRAILDLIDQDDKQKETVNMNNGLEIVTQ
jgi:hypothetical protein